MDSPCLTREERQQLIDLLISEQCSCVIRSGDTIRIFRQRGVLDLHTLLNREPELLRGAFVADKVVGKGAAALMILGGVKELFANVLSRPALELLQRHNIPTSYTTLTDHIINRSRTDWCPVERLCQHLQSPEACLSAITDFLLGKA